MVSGFIACSRPTASRATSSILRRSCVDCRPPTPPAREDGCDRRRDAAAHADGLAARRAAGLLHDGAAKPERRGPPPDLARARSAAKNSSWSAGTTLWIGGVPIGAEPEDPHRRGRSKPI